MTRWLPATQVWGAYPPPLLFVWGMSHPPCPLRGSPLVLASRDGAVPPVLAALARFARAVTRGRSGLSCLYVVLSRRMPVAVAPLVGIALGALFAWASIEELSRVGGSVASRSLVVTMLFST